MKLAFIKIIAALALLAPSTFAAALESTFRASTASASIGGSATYTAILTNTANVSLGGIRVTVSFPAALTAGETKNANNPLSVPTITSTNVVFDAGTLPAGGTNVLSVTLVPAFSGTFSVRISVDGQEAGNAAETFTLAVGAGQADLSVQIGAIPRAILAFDLVSYQLRATNLGPSQASGVLLTHTIPANALIISNSAGSIATRTASNQIVFNLGTLSNGAGRTISMTLQPTNTGNFPLSASIAGNNITDPAGNSTVTNLLVVQALSTNNLLLTRSSPMAFNRDTALIEELITVQNVGATNIFGGVRILVDGIESPDRLFNSSGTNGLTPYVASTNGLRPGQSVPIRMQYYFKDRTPHTNVTLTAVQGPIITTNITTTNLTGQATLTGTASNSVLNISAVSGQKFAIQSSDSVPFPPNPTVVTNITATGSSISVSNVVSPANSQLFFRAVPIP